MLFLFLKTSGRCSATDKRTYLLVISADGSFEEENVLSFSFGKDAYTPYTSLSVRLCAEADTFLTATEVKFFVMGNLVHHGLIDRLTCELSGGSRILTLSSRGFTSLLCQNQIEPGLKTGVSINNLMDSYYTLPYVTHEDNPDQSSYIYVKNNSSMWDGIVNLSYKHCGTYPYIRETNCVRITPMEAPLAFAYENEKLISVGEVLQSRRLISHLHMADMGGDFGNYELTDPDVTELGIVRHIFFELDRQFLNEPQDALVYRDKFASRAFRQRFCTYKGYNGEDLSDIVSFADVESQRIAAVDISGSRSMITTKISVYYDKFPRDTEAFQNQN